MLKPNRKIRPLDRVSGQVWSEIYADLRFATAGTISDLRKALAFHGRFGCSFLVDGSGSVYCGVCGSKDPGAQ